MNSTIRYGGVWHSIYKVQSTCRKGEKNQVFVTWENIRVAVLEYEHHGFKKQIAPVYVEYNLYLHI